MTKPRALLTLTLLADRYAVCRLDPGTPLPKWAMQGEFWSLTQAKDELSIVCSEKYLPSDVRGASGWRAFRFEGPLDFGFYGIIASVAEPLANAGVGIFPIATHETDYMLVNEEQLDTAIQALGAYGHAVHT